MDKNLFNRIKGGLKKTRDNISSKLGDVMSSFKKVDEDFLEELEETLILCDIGVHTSARIMEGLRKLIKEKKITETSEVKGVLEEIITELLSFDDDGLSYPAVFLIVGVNGVGKTTAIGKMAYYYKQQGRDVMLAAADTFRAAASEQLVQWGDRAGVKVVKYGEGADPAAVVYDAIDSAKHKNNGCADMRHGRASAQQKEPDGRTQEDRARDRQIVRRSA